MAEEPDMIAGEYVLRTLDDGEHRAFQRRLLTDSTAANDVAQWQDRLAPLLLTIVEAPPPPALWSRIEEAAQPANDNRVRRWQAATAAAAVLALLTSGLALRPQPTVPTAPPPVAQPSPLLQSIAALSEKGEAPALLVTYDRNTGALKVTPVKITPRPGHDLELWVIAGKAPPRSIGLMREKGATAIEKPDLATGEGLTIAVSLEPKGGSPTGLPTGPVLYSGQMVDLPTS